MLGNYDEIRDKQDNSFIIRGETFTVKRARPEIMGTFQKMEEDFMGKKEPSYEDLIAFAEERLLLLIDDQNGAVDRWRALRASEDDPITYGEIMDISRKAVETVTGLPTMPQEPSVPGRGKTAASSKAG